MKKNLTSAAAYLADFGTVVYVAAAILIASAALAELLSPGFVATAVAPQAFAVVALAGGAMSLLAPEERRRSAAARIAFAAFGMAATVFAFWAAWQYFAPVPDARTRLSSAFAAAIGLTLLLFYE